MTIGQLHQVAVIAAISVTIAPTPSATSASDAASSTTSTIGIAAQNEELPAPAQREQVQLVDVPDEFANMAMWAVGLFEEANLRLPPMRFVHHREDRAPCSGWKGVHRYEDGISEIGICTNESGPLTEWLVLHEIAHAWAAHSLTNEQRGAFQSLRGWTHWRAAQWHESGAEHAAEILAWGLIDRPVGIVTIKDNSCDDLEAGYRTLTGQEPLHGYRDYC